MFRSFCFCFFKQKTSYEMRISDWSSDVCSSDLLLFSSSSMAACICSAASKTATASVRVEGAPAPSGIGPPFRQTDSWFDDSTPQPPISSRHCCSVSVVTPSSAARSEEHTSELQSLMRISYAVCCLKNKNMQKM